MKVRCPLYRRILKAVDGEFSENKSGKRKEEEERICMTFSLKKTNIISISIRDHETMGE